MTLNFTEILHKLHLELKINRKLQCLICQFYLFKVGGMDISFSKTNPSTACACLVVLSYPKLKVICF